MLPAIFERPGRPFAVVSLLLFVLVAGLAIASMFVPGSLGVVAVAAIPALGAAAVAPSLIRRIALPPLRTALVRAEELLGETRRRLHEERTNRSLLREFDAGLDNAPDEDAALELIQRALIRFLPGRSAEVFLVDPVDPILDLAVATADDAAPAARTSPWDSLAARSNTTLVYTTTDRLDVCPHLASRTPDPAAAVAIPLNATGRLLGVLYVFDPVGTEVVAAEVAHFEELAAIIAARLAILRTAAPPRSADAIDRLTGLPNRSAMQERVIRVLETRQPFTVAVADIDGFTGLNRKYGRDAGDRALQLAARIARKAMRPDDIIGRVGGDELLVILPRTTPDDATRALERLREELVLAQSLGADPNFTLSIGVIGSMSGGTIEDLLHRAAGALTYAKNQGGNRVVVAQRASKTESGAA